MSFCPNQDTNISAFSLPENFFDKKILLPDFYMPENHDLEIATSNTIKKTLFNEIYLKIKFIEYMHINSEKDFFKFKKISLFEPNLYERTMCYLRLKYFVILKTF